MVDFVLANNLVVANLLMAVSDAVVGAIQAAKAEDLAAAAFLGFLGLCVVMEFRHPFFRPGLKALKRSYATNVSTFLLNDITLSVLAIPSLGLVAQGFSRFGLLGSMANTPAKYLLAFVLLDLTLYVWHYATHHSDMLWLFHKVHHSDRSFNVTTGLRFHVGELFLEALVRVLFIVAFGVSAEVVLVNQTLISLFVLFHHTNISFPFERMLSKVLIVPRLHRMHHSTIREEHDSNYGAVLSLWDRLFGTLKEGEPQSIGLNGIEHQGFAELVKYGFTRRIEPQRSPPLVDARESA